MADKLAIESVQDQWKVHVHSVELAVLFIQWRGVCRTGGRSNDSPAILAIF